MSVAPMMDRTDRHFRWFLRLLSRRVLLYSEMVTTGAIQHGDRERILGFSAEERPLVLQIGSDDPRELADAARVGEDLGYDEINLNVGCPSDAVQRGRFGACLMNEPERVAEGVAAMRAAVRVPVTVKHRIGVDDRDHYEDMCGFVETVAAAGCDRFIVHARKAWLSGLSPKQNRSTPPLRYEEVHRLKREHPDLCIEINGGLRSIEQMIEQLEHTDGVMIGRAMYDDPMLLARADREILGEPSPAPTRRQLLEAMIPYVESWHARGEPVKNTVRHLHGLFAGVPGARVWRRYLAEHVLCRGALPRVLPEALARMPDAALDRPIAAPPNASPLPGRGGASSVSARRAEERSARTGHS